MAFASCNNVDEKTEATHDEATEATADTAVAFENENEPDSAADDTMVDIDASGDADWNNLDVDMPTVDWPEFKDTDVDVRSNDKYSVYALGENVLFDTDKATIKKSAEANLQKVSASIAKRSKDAPVRVYGYTDAKGSAGYNEDLAKQRAEAVKNWLQKNGNIDASRISVHPVGEAKPVRSNETAAGRQQNRRVEIAVRNS
jgi:outer membrane protein OmpA-like peptidoglycan-associated protein